MKLALLYALFAALATAANLGAQWLLSAAYTGAFEVFLALVFGTGVGLVVKYALDKRYIFRFKTTNLAHDGQIFVLYTVMGLATTVIFWGFELGFEWAFSAPVMRYVGGAIGLAIGYWAKYQLDKRYVFRAKTA